MNANIFFIIENSNLSLKLFPVDASRKATTTTILKPVAGLVASKM